MNYRVFFRFRWIRVMLVATIIISALSTTEADAQQPLAPSPENNNSQIRNFSGSSKSLNQPFFTDLRDDFSYLFRQRDFYEVVISLGLAPFIFKYQFDNESPEFTEHWGPSKSADYFFELGESLGSPLCPLAASALIFVLADKRQNSSLKSFGSDLLRAQIFNGLVTTSIKGLINRKRPDGTPYSYPSGHTSTAFTSAGVLYHHFGARVGIPAYIAASYVGLSRLQENKHYVTDIAAGAIIGTYISYKIVNRNKPGKNFGIGPTKIQGSPALNLTLRF